VAFLKGTVKNYPARNLQVITVFRDGFNVGCYCHDGFGFDDYGVVGSVLKQCHLHKPKKERKTKNTIDTDEKIDFSESSIRRSKTKVLDYALSDYFDYFLTLTFDPKKVDSLDHEKTTNTATP